MNRAAAAAAGPASGPPDWALASMDPHTHSDPWELARACSVLRDLFIQIFPVLKPDNDLLADVLGINQLDKIMPVVGEDFVDLASPSRFAFAALSLTLPSRRQA